MKVETLRFGTLEIDESSIVRMPKGPLGFEEYNEYCLIQHRPDTNFKWLQSVQEPALAFVVVDPSDFFTGYEIEISDADAESLHLSSSDDATVLTLITISDSGRDITANLAAPIVINSKELIGMQIVLQDNRYSVRQPIIQKVEQSEINEESKTHVNAA